MSRNVSNVSNALLPSVFQIMGQSKIELFASHQLSHYANNRSPDDLQVKFECPSPILHEKSDFEPMDKRRSESSRSF